jgi:outer membrane protein assembly factor BamE (lipoprotein component of BamABCDE complex)
MKLTYFILTLSLILANCSPVMKPHGYQLEDLVNSEPLNIGISTKDDLVSAYGSPSIKIEDVSNTWLYLASTKEKKVFVKDEFTAQVIFAFNFDNNNVLISQEVYDESNISEFKFNESKTFNNGTNYSILDQLYDAFTRGL